MGFLEARTKKILYFTNFMGYWIFRISASVITTKYGFAIPGVGAIPAPTIDVWGYEKILPCGGPRSATYPVLIPGCDGQGVVPVCTTAGIKLYTLKYSNKRRQAPPKKIPNFWVFFLIFFGVKVDPVSGTVYG